MFVCHAPTLICLDIAVSVLESMGMKPKFEGTREIMKHQNERFFVPVDTHVEIHTCVGIICIVLQHLSSIAAILVVSIVGIIVLVKKGNKKHKQA